MPIQLVGFDKAALKIAMLEPEVRTRIVSAIQATTNDALSMALSRVPRKTGELAGTLRADISRSGLTGMVKAGYGQLARKQKGESAKARKVRSAKQKVFGPQLAGSYAAIVEFGGRTRPPHPYLVPAVEAVRASHQARIEQALRDGVAARADAGAA